MSDPKPDMLPRRDFIKRIAAGAVVGAAGAKLAAAAVDTSKIRSYNPQMEYRSLGKTGLVVSAVCMGGHWKRMDIMVPGVFGPSGNWLNADIASDGFKKNRAEVLSRCIERGINYVDACTRQEALAYGEALKGRRDSVYLGFSWYQEEMRNEKYRTAEALVGTLEKGMKEAGLDYVDVWRITMHEQSSRHTEAEVEQMMKGLAMAREQGKARFTGFSSHDRPHIKWMIETYPEVVQVVCTPFTAKSKEAPTDSLFETTRKYEVGVFGIKPFGGTSLFKGDSSPGNPQAAEDDELARLTIRHILATDAITAPIPGLITPQQVDNMARAVQERRELGREEKAKLNKATDEMFAKLPPEYEWLKDWEWV